MTTPQPQKTPTKNVHAVHLCVRVLCWLFFFACDISFISHKYARNCSWRVSGCICARIKAQHHSATSPADSCWQSAQLHRSLPSAQHSHQLHHQHTHTVLSASHHNIHQAPLFLLRSFCGAHFIIYWNVFAHECAQLKMLCAAQSHCVHDHNIHIYVHTHIHIHIHISHVRSRRPSNAIGQTSYVAENNP